MVRISFWFMLTTLTYGRKRTYYKNTELLVVVNKEIGLAVNADKNKYMTMSRDQNAGQNHNVKIDKLLERVEQCKYLGPNLTNQNSIQEEIKSRLMSENACCHSVQNILFSSLLFKKKMIKIYRTVILPVVLHECESWSLTLPAQRRLRVFENRVLRRIFGPKGDGVTGDCRKVHNEELTDLSCSTNINQVIKSRKVRWFGNVARMRESRGAYRILVGKPEGKGPLGRHRPRWEGNIKIDLEELGCGPWALGGP